MEVEIRKVYQYNCIKGSCMGKFLRVQTQLMLVRMCFYQYSIG